MSGIDPRDPNLCPACGKPLAPYWCDWCRHCWTAFSPAFAASRRAAGLSIPTIDLGPFKILAVVIGVVLVVVSWVMLSCFMVAGPDGLVACRAQSGPYSVFLLLSLTLIGAGILAPRRVRSRRSR